MSASVEWKVLSPEVIERVVQLDIARRRVIMKDDFDFAKSLVTHSAEVKGSNRVTIERQPFAFADPVEVARAKAVLESKLKAAGP